MSDLHKKFQALRKSIERQGSLNAEARRSILDGLRSMEKEARRKRRTTSSPGEDEPSTSASSARTRGIVPRPASGPATAAAPATSPPAPPPPPELQRTRLRERLERQAHGLPPPEVLPTVIAHHDDTTTMALKRAAAFSLMDTPEHKRFRAIVDQDLAPIIKARTLHKPYNLLENKHPSDLASTEIKEYDEKWHRENLIYSDSRYKVFIRQVNFASHKTMALRDYLFQLKVVDKREGEENYSAPPLIELLSELWCAMRDAVTEIASSLDPRSEHQIFICFHSDQFSKSAGGRVNNIETGNFPLRNDPDVIRYCVDGSLTLLEACLRSNDNIDLNASFMVTFKTMSVNRTQLAKQGIRVGNAPSIAAYKIKNLLSNANHKTLFLIPQTKEFANLCLPTSIVLGYYRKRFSMNKLYPGSYHEDDAKIYNKMKSVNCINHTGKKTRDYATPARRVLLEHAKKLCTDLGFDYNNGPFPMEEFVALAARHLHVQIQVYSNMGSRRILVCPEKYNDRLAQIYLYCEEYPQGEAAVGTDATEYHMSLILNIRAFNRKSGWVCDHCGQLRRHNHFCRVKGVTCFGCQRIIVRDDSKYLDKDSIKLYCLRYAPDSKMVENTCLKCNVTMYTEECFKRHCKSKSSCLRGFVCKAGCGRYICRKNKDVSLDEIKREHRCDLETCRICYAEYTVGEGDGGGRKMEHLCRMPQQKKQKLHRPLGIYDIESAVLDLPIACSSCYDLESKYADAHADKVTRLQRLMESMEIGGAGLSREPETPVTSRTLDDAEEPQVRGLFRRLLNADSANDIDWIVVSSYLRTVEVRTLRRYFFDPIHTTRRISRREIGGLLKMNILEWKRVRCEKHADDATEIIDHGLHANYQDGQHFPNFACLYFESQRHGNWSRVDFADPRMNYPNRLQIFHNILQYDYLPAEVTDRTLNTRNVRTSSGRSDKPSSSTNTFPMPFLDTLEAPSQDDEDETTEEEEEHWLEDEGEEVVDVHSFLNDECAADRDDEGEDGEEEEEEEEGNEGEGGGQLRKKRQFTKRLMFGKEDLDERDIARANTIDQFLLTILNEKFRNYAFISHNGANYDIQLIIKRIFAHGINCQVITRSSRLMRVLIPSFNIVFLDSILYLNSSLSSLTKSFGLEISKGHFPHSYNLPCFYNHGQEGQDKFGVPPLVYFKSFNDSKEMIAEKEAFVKDLQEKNTPWVFTEEISKYCALDVEILVQVCCRFLEQSYKFQQKMILESEGCGGVNEREEKMRDNDETPAELSLDMEVTEEEDDDEEAAGEGRSVTPVAETPLSRKLAYFSPFSDPYLTLSSYIYGMWRHFVLPAYDVCAVNDERGLNSVATSRAEMEMALFLQEVIYPNETVQSAFTSAHPARFSRYTPDVYVGGNVNKTYAMNGCMDHIHRSKECTGPNMHWATSSENPINPRGVSYAEIQKRANAQANLLESRFNISRDRQIEIWECEWNRWKKATPADLDRMKEWERKRALQVQTFMAGFDKLRPRQRLIPRDALRGGKVEAYLFWWSSATAPPGQTLWYLDYNSLYPSQACAEENLFPIGPPEFFIRDADLNRIQFLDGQAYLLDDADGNPLPGGQRQQIGGLFCCAILPPRNSTMVRPFLSIRVMQQDPKTGTKSEKSLSVLCRTCAEKMQKTVCNHSVQERCLVSTWCLVEIAYALTLGYELVARYESYVYRQGAHLFKTFLERFTRYKIQYSGFPKDVVDSPAGRKEYTDSINAGMKWKPGDENYVSEEDIVENAAQRAYYKLAQNSLLGKLGQENERKNFSVNISSQVELDKLYYERPDCTIKDFVVMSDHVVEVIMEKKPGLGRAGNIRSNCVLASHVTGFARIEIDKAMRSLEKIGAVIYYTDTDSLVFTLPPGVKSNLPEGACLYQWKNEIPQGWILSSFYCLAPKLYEMTITEVKTGKTEVWTKVKGFTVTSARQKEILGKDIFRTFVENYLKNIDMSISVGQWNIRCDKARNLRSVISEKLLKNCIFSKRVTFRGEQYRDNKNNYTLPFGYNQKMYSEFLM